MPLTPDLFYKFSQSKKIIFKEPAQNLPFIFPEYINILAEFIQKENSFKHNTKDSKKKIKKIIKIIKFVFHHLEITKMFRSTFESSHFYCQR